ncbi:hypothetical protein BTUL_0239g00050 [Botrytis tulipae]|uniref:Uncharacterized protein n=1 Tax=Botrytis tulipae TaxID=87230 RepID=A0A4Z1E751_9HELO|nr:hypothetical protein BTUL_0239g00050 [Botrytis tulipae]
MKSYNITNATDSSSLRLDLSTAARSFGKFLFNNKDLQPLFQDFIATSKVRVSWNMFLEGWRTFSIPDQIEKALFEVWPINISRKSSYSISYRVRWEAPKYIREHFVEGQLLGDVLTLTGNTSGTIALNCRDYLRSAWQDIGLYISEAVEARLCNKVISAKHDVLDIDLLYNNIEDKSNVEIKITANHCVHEQAVLAMSWVCAVSRKSLNETLYYSSVLVKCLDNTLASELGSSRRSVDRISLVTYSLLITPESAGTHYFLAYLLPRDFQSNRAPMVRGLEISFPDMALVTGCLSLVMFDGGLVANGLNSVLFPVGEIMEDNPMALLPENDARLEESKPIRLIERRCFLGWVPEASILIGTGKYPVANREWSKAAKVPDNRPIKSYSLTFGTGGTGLITATGSLGWTTSSMPSTITRKIEKDIHEVLKDGENDTILMYDSERQIARYLPKSCVVLFLAHARITHLGWQVVRGSEITHLNLAKPSSSGLEANNALISNLQLQLKKTDSQSVNGYRLDSLGGFVKAIWQALDDIGTGLRSIQKEFSRAQEGPPRYIYGVEYMDTVDMREEKETKRVAISQPWAYLTKDYPATIFCGSLKHPIVPDRPELICQAWQIVSSGKDHLVVTSSVVQHFLRKAREGLCEHVEWRFDGELINNHRIDKKGTVHHGQRLFTTSSPQPNHSLLELLAEIPNGSFIFTQSKLSKGCSESIPSQAVTQISGCDGQNRRIKLDLLTESTGKYTKDVLRHGNGLYSLGKEIATSSDLSTSAHHDNLMENHRLSPLIRYPIVIPRSPFHIPNEEDRHKALKFVPSPTTDISSNDSFSKENFAEASSNRYSLISTELCRNSNGRSVANSSQDSQKIIRKSEKVDLRTKQNIIQSDSGNE